VAQEEIADQLLQLERSAMRRWIDGDPSGFLEISDDDVVYFDPFIDRRLDGIAALRAYYEALRGTIHADRFEILNPHVQSQDGMAVLTYNFVSYAGEGNCMRWNCTEVYRKREAGWRIIQSHWSLTRGK
jgi:hypothetical protein